MPIDQDFQQRPPRRTLPLRYLFSALAALFILPILIWLVWGWIEAARLDRALDALEARQEPLDIDDFNAKPTTPEQRQASHVLARARQLIANLPLTSELSASLAGTIETFCESDGGPTGQEDILRAFEARYAAVFDLLDRANDLGVAGWDDADRPRRASMEEMHTIALVRANLVRIARRACTGEADAAAAALLATLRLRHVWYSGPILMQTAHSVRLVMSSKPISPALLEKLQAEFASIADDRIFEKWIARERAFWLSFLMPGVFSEVPDGYRPRRITPLEAIAIRLVRPLRDRRSLVELREFDEAMEIAKQPWPQKIDTVRSFADTHPANHLERLHPSLLDSLTRPYGVDHASRVMGSYIEPIAETLARARASIGLIAVARYKRDHSGQLPESLQQLVPQYLSAPPIDPYTGTGFHYWQKCGGYKVYSVGINRKDDGGMWERQSDLRQSRRGNPLDVGIEVGFWPRVCR